MTIDVTHYLRCVSDRFTQVRDNRGNLVGCVPKVPDSAQGLQTNNGPAMLRIAALACLCIEPTQDPRSLPGFIALDPTQMDLLIPPTTTEAPDAP